MKATEFRKKENKEYKPTFMAKHLKRPYKIATIDLKETRVTSAMVNLYLTSESFRNLVNKYIKNNEK